MHDLTPICSRELNRILKAITVLTAKPERGAEDVQRLKTQVKKLEDLFSHAATVEEGEVPHPLKLIQIHLKHTLLNSEKIKGLTVDTWMRHR